MSWTTDIDVARSFAYDGSSSRPVGNVYTARVQPSSLLAFIADEGLSESEWVIDPGELLDDAVKFVEVAEDDARRNHDRLGTFTDASDPRL